jgi:hypothetical protein
VAGRLGALAVVAVAVLGWACGASAPPARAPNVPPHWDKELTRVQHPNRSVEVVYPSFLTREPANDRAWLVLSYGDEVAKTFISIDVLRSCAPPSPSARRSDSVESCVVLASGDKQVNVGYGHCRESGSRIFWWLGNPTVCANVWFQVSTASSFDVELRSFLRELPVHLHPVLPAASAPSTASQSGHD